MLKRDNLVMKPSLKRSKAQLFRLLHLGQQKQQMTLASPLLFLDLKARVIPPSATNGGWYRIVLGPFKTVRDMRAAADVLTKNGYSALVRRE